MSTDTVELPIVNSQKTCKVNSCYAHWFEDKPLYMDKDGVYYHYQGGKRKFYVHNQILPLATADGLKEPPPGKNKLEKTVQFTMFILQHCDPDVLEYVQAKRIQTGV